MTHEAIGLTFDEHWYAGANAGHRVSSGLANREETLSINVDSAESEGSRAIAESVASGRVVGANTDSESVVLADEEDGEVPDGRKIEALVQNPLVDCAIAEEDGRNTLSAERAIGKRNPNGERD